MSATTAGPATGTASLVFGVPTESIEVQVPNGLPSLGPAQAPFVDPAASTYQDVAGTKASNVNATNTILNFGTLGTGIKFALPA